MRWTVLTLATTAAALALVAGCNKNPEGGKAATPSQSSAPAQSSTPTTPANIGAPTSQAEKKEGANPVQGQVDPKAAEQHRDFQQKGDASGPKSADTAPKSGG